VGLGFFTMKHGQISLVVVDDHPKARNAINALLKAEKDIVIVGEAANGAQAIDLALSQRPDVMLLDIELPDLRGTAVMRHLNKIRPDLKVLAVSSYNDRQFILGMMENGASGYLVKDEIPSMLLPAIRSVIYKGSKWVGSRFPQKGSNPKLEQTLTKKEADILRQWSIGKTESMIAIDLNMKEKQVNEYLALMMKKYEVKSLSELKSIGQQIFSDFKK